MRIIGGEFKGRRFTPPAKNWPTRPTTDYAKEALFNIITNTLDFESLKVLDLFGGSGSLSYEFISRGCNEVTYIDSFPGCIKFVKETAKKLGIESKIRIFKSDVLKFIDRNGEQFDFIFADPPYAMAGIDSIPDRIFKNNLLKENGWFVMEHNSNHNFKDHPHCFDSRNYGKTLFSFFK